MKGIGALVSNVLYNAHLGKNVHWFYENRECWQKNFGRDELPLVRVLTTMHFPVTIPGRAGARPYRRRFSESALMAQ